MKLYLRCEIHRTKSLVDARNSLVDDKWITASMVGTAIKLCASVAFHQEKLEAFGI